MNICITFMEFEIHDLFKWILMQNIAWTYLKWEVMIVNLCGNASIESSYYSNNFRLKLKKESALCNGGASTRLVPYYRFCCTINFGNCKISNQIKHIFSHVDILSNLHQCRLQTNDFEKIFCSQNWPNDLRLSCKDGPKNMANVIVFEVDSEKGLEKNLKGLLKKSLMFDVHDW